jgi:putative membrane protein (TIGR04086 family)
MKSAELKFESYFGAVLMACGVTWIWDFVSSIYFAGQIALSLTIISFLVYLEAGFIGAFVLARKLPRNHILIGLRVGFGAFLMNLAFRMILFELTEALWGVIIYLISFTMGGMLGGLLASKVHVGKKNLFLTKN